MPGGPKHEGSSNKDKWSGENAGSVEVKEGKSPLGGTVGVSRAGGTSGEVGKRECVHPTRAGNERPRHPKEKEPTRCAEQDLKNQSPLGAERF